MASSSRPQSCPHCGKPLSDGSSFCNACGQPVSTATLRVEPTPELLAAAGKRAREVAPPSTAEALAAVRPPPSPLAGVAAVIALVALSLGAAVFILKRKTHEMQSRTPVGTIAAEIDVTDRGAAPSAPTMNGSRSATPASRPKKLVPRVEERTALDTKTAPAKSEQAHAAAPRTEPPQSAPPNAAPPKPEPPKPEPAKEEKIDPADVATALSADGVQFVVRTHLAQARACYERAFKDAPQSPGGRLEVAFAINAQGKAVRLRTAEDSFNNAQLSHCIEQRIASWQFPRPVLGDEGEPEFQYPFVFSGQ